MTFERLAADGGLAQLDGPGPVWIFKHSLTCPISARAMAEVVAFKRRTPEARVVLVEVQPERRLSRILADRLSVPHASPQVILVVHGVAVWNASHFGVSAAALDRSLAAVGAASASRRPA